jgi:hypothetical protein
MITWQVSERSKNSLHSIWNAANGRKARLQRSPQEGPESAQEPSFQCERGLRFTAQLDRRSYGQSMNLMGSESKSKSAGALARARRSARGRVD